MNEKEMQKHIEQVYSIALAALAGPNGGEKRAYKWGDGIVYEPVSRTVSIDIVDSLSQGDRRPVTSNAVQIEIGNIEVLLQTI